MSLIKSALDLSEMRDIAARICRDYLTGAWKTITADEIKLKKISGGLSNFLFYVSLPDDNVSTGNSPRSNLSAKRPRKDSLQDVYEPREVLLRIYGQTHGEQALETMVTESVVFTLLSERKLGPKLHGIFPGGRIEQYIPARPLTTLELSDTKITSKIATKMAEIHSLDIPVSKEPDWLWSTMNRWLQSVETILSNVLEKNERLVEIEKQFKKMNYHHEIEWLKKEVDQNNFPVVFSHNDLQEGNILLQQNDNNSSLDRFSSTPLDNFDDSAIDNHLSSILISSNSQRSINTRDVPPVSYPQNNANNINNNNSRKRFIDEVNIPEMCDFENTRDSVLSSDTFGNSSEENCDPDLMIIDFEYCAYNYRSFDLANHFLEWTFDYTNEEHPYYHFKKEQYPTLEQREKFITEYLRECHEEKEDYTPDQNEINEILQEVKCFSLASHMFWSLWALVNIQSEIQFGYYEYASTRINEYLACKEDYMKTRQDTNVRRY